MKVTGRINYIFTLLCGESLRKFDELLRQNTNNVNVHLKSIQ